MLSTMPTTESAMVIRGRANLTHRAILLPAKSPITFFLRTSSIMRDHHGSRQHAIDDRTPVKRLDRIDGSKIQEQRRGTTESASTE